MKNWDFRRAFTALKKLVANPDDLPQVFTLIETLQGDVLSRFRRGFEAEESGRALLRDQPDLVPLLANRDALRAMPEGSLGREYLKFVEAEGISADGIIAASEAGAGYPDDEFKFIRARMRDTHDLWHAVTGYHGDVRGELALLYFNLGQIFHFGIFAILVAAWFKGLGGADWWLMADGYVRGKRAKWLPAVQWEAWLDKPVTEVRRALNVGEPRVYDVLRSSELRERGIITA